MDLSMDPEIDYYFIQLMEKANVLNDPKSASTEFGTSHLLLHLLPAFAGRRLDRVAAQRMFCRCSEIMQVALDKYKDGDYEEAIVSFTAIIDTLEDAPPDWPDCSTLAAAALLKRMSSRMKLGDRQDQDLLAVVADSKIVTSTTGRCAFATPMQRAEGFLCRSHALKLLGRDAEALEAAECMADCSSKRTRARKVVEMMGTPTARPESMRSIIQMVAACDTEQEVQALRYILNSGFRPNQKDADNFQLQLEYQGRMGPLDMIASRLRHIDIRALSLFLDAGADPNSRRERWITPLMNAASLLHIEACRLLLAAGADINATDEKGFTPLMIAASASKLDDIPDLMNEDLPHEQYMAMSTAMVKFLIENGADVTHQSLQSGRTALTLAAIQGNTETCRLLLDAGAPPSPVTWHIIERDNEKPRVYSDCPLYLAVQGDNFRVPECEIAALIRSRMMAGSSRDRAMVHAVDWIALCRDMEVKFQSFSAPKEGSGKPRPAGGRKGAAEAVAQMQGMADWMAARAGVERPHNAAGNPLLAIYRYLHGTAMPRELTKIWSDFSELTQDEADIMWQVSSAHSDRSPIWIPPDESRGFMMPFGNYVHLIQNPLNLTYAMGIPTDEALDVIAEHSPVVEIGAGTGYWAALLRDRGCRVIAYDIAPPSPGDFGNMYHHKAYTEVLKGGPGAAGSHPDSALLLVWPWGSDRPIDANGELMSKDLCGTCGESAAPGKKLRWCGGCHKVKYCSAACQKMAWKTGHKERCKALADEASERKGLPEPWDIAALRAYTGDIVIYVGEWEGRTFHHEQGSGCSSSRQFQDALSRDFSCVRQLALPNWRAELADLSVWHRKSAVVYAPRSSATSAAVVRDNNELEGSLDTLHPGQDPAQEGKGRKVIDDSKQGVIDHTASSQWSLLRGSASVKFLAGTSIIAGLTVATLLLLRRRTLANVHGAYA